LSGRFRIIEIPVKDTKEERLGMRSMNRGRQNFKPAARWRTKLTTISLILSLFAGLAVFTPRAALAKNYCISGFPNPSWLEVGIQFRIPPKGKCKQWLGFNPADGDNRPVSGIGCTSSDGTNFSAFLTNSDEPGGFIEQDSISLSLPAQTGEYVGQFISGSAVSSFGPTTGISGALCAHSPIPAAKSNGEQMGVPRGSAGLP